MLLVGNGLLLTRDDNNTVIENGCVAIKDHLITEIGTTRELKEKYQGAKFLDVDRKLIMPGLINTHMHFYSTFARGMEQKGAPPVSFGEILKKLWWKLDKALDLEDIYYSAMVPVIECIKNGVTTVFDHHSSPSCVSGSLFTVAEATRRAGLRACLCYEVSDRDGYDVTKEGIQENVDFINYCNKEQDPLLKGMFGLHASFTLSDATLEKCVNLNEGSGVGFHIHAAEGIEDLQYTKSTYGKGVIERLQERGILGNKSIAVHCVHISKEEMKLLKATDTCVIHNPESNMGNAVGVAPVLELLEEGVLLGMGTDGYTSDMLESFKVAICLHKHDRKNPSLAYKEPPLMLFENNAKIAERYFQGVLGKLVKGAFADVIVVDYKPPTPLTSSNLNSHLLFGVSGRAVDTTIIHGRVVMENRRITLLNEAEIYERSREAAIKVWERMK